ncbi:MAG: DUF3108 domain-containing protein [Rikenella sp.]|nr:DUF3108 domain-containing protein [Rikenella sp.]
MKLFSTLAVMGLLFGSGGRAEAQQPTRTEPVAPAFGPGEELTYTASYSAAVVSTDVATITFRTSTDQVEGIPCFRIRAHGQTQSFFSVFFKMDDVYETWIEQASLRPILATAEIKEGSYRYRSRLAFNWKAGRVYTQGKNLKKGYERGRTMTISARDFDPVAHFFNLRCLPGIDSMKRGERGSLNLVMVDTIRTVRYRFLGREIIDAPATGPVRCLKFTCQLAPGDADSFKEGTDFFIWISDDRNRIPIYLETPIRVGRVQASLSGWKNLAHPFDAKLK